MLKRTLSILFSATIGFSSIAAANSSWDPITYDRHLGMRVVGGIQLMSTRFDNENVAISEGQRLCNARKRCDHFDIRQAEFDNRRAYTVRLFSRGQRSYTSIYQTYTKLNRDLSVDSSFRPVFCTGENGDGKCSPSNGGQNKSAIVKVKYTGNGILHTNIAPVAVTVFHAGANRPCRGRVQLTGTVNSGDGTLAIVNIGDCMRIPGRSVSVTITTPGWTDFEPRNNRHVFR